MLLDLNRILDVSLPSFDAPPLNETVLGVEFTPIQRWSIPYFGLFWDRIRKEYPRCEVKAPLARQDEKRPLPVAGQLIELLQQPEARCWFYDSTEHRLLQVQPDRFIHNWRRQGTPDVYPRYGKIRSIFERELGRFKEFVDAEGLGSISVDQCEVTYVNHLEQGREWATLSDLANVVTFWNGFPSGHPAPDSIQAVATFMRDDMRLRLHAQHAIRNADLKEIVVFTLSARGKPRSAQPQDVLGCLDNARAWVVKSFEELTTPAMHKLWKRRS
jgi:uncharacterized protein (TIGR04255 family)